MTFIMLKKKNFTVHLLLTNPAAVFLNDICLRNFHITVSIFSTRKRAVGNSWHYITSCSLNLTLQTIKNTFVTVDFIVPPKSTWMMKILVTLLTFIRLFSGVKPFMSLQNSCCTQTPATLFTFNWLFPSVNTFMRLQAYIMTKTFFFLVNSFMPP